MQSKPPLKRPPPPTAKRFPPKKPSLKLIKLGNKLYAPCLALVVVIGCAAAGTGDFMLVMPEVGVGTGSKAKSLEVCERARQAAWEGTLPGIPAGTPSRCDPAPGAFTERSETIPGFNAPKGHYWPPIEHGDQQ